MMPAMVLLFLGLFVACGAERFKTMTLNPGSLGVILGLKGEPAGSAFVVGNPSRILTCWHVIEGLGTNRCWFQNNRPVPQSATVETVLPRFDLAVLRPDWTNQLPSLSNGDIRRVRPGDDIVYGGWNTGSKSFKVTQAMVSAIGVALNDEGSVDFIEFQGEGVPGWSGGPVFNAKGEVVALMREAWNKKGIKGGPVLLVNRALSIEPAMLSIEIRSSPKALPISQSPEGSAAQPKQE